MLNLQPVTYKEACGYIKEHHRHHLPPQGWKFGIAVNNGVIVVGVITIGRPVARNFDDKKTLEVTRCCTNGMRNACSKLYRAAWNVTKNLGYKRLITYTLKSESGSSLRASGYKILHEVKGRSWDCDSRSRIDKHPITDKICWEINNS